MKFTFDKRYMRIIYHIVVCFLLLLFTYTMYNLIISSIADFTQTLDSFGDTIGKFISIFSPLFIGFIIAYLLDPIVDFFQNKWNYYIYEKKIFQKLLRLLYEKFPTFKNLFDRKRTKKNSKIRETYKKAKQEEAIKKQDNYETRTAGTLLTFISVVLVLYFGLKLLVGSIIKTTSGDQITLSNITSSFESGMSGITSQIANVTEYFSSALANFGVEANGITEKIVSSISNILVSFINFITNFIVGFFSHIGAISGFVVTFFLSVVLAFYMLQNKSKFKGSSLYFLETIFPRKFRNVIIGILKEIHTVFSGYIRGQLTDASIMAVLLTIGLTIINVPFAAVIAFISGFSNIIPYVGAFVGFVLAVISAFLTGDMTIVIGAIVVVLIVQQLDSLFIAPKVVGNSVEISPFLVLLSLSVGGKLFGMLGMILAVPVTAILKIFITRFMARQSKSKSIKRALGSFTSLNNETNHYD
ncbi:MAG: AI-2E family transporter [Lachnospirales bacterium]